MSMENGSPQGQEPQPVGSGGLGAIDLCDRYGAIGIVAVAAAVRFARAGDKRDAAHAAPQIEQRFIELAT